MKKAEQPLLPPPAPAPILAPLQVISDDQIFQSLILEVVKEVCRDFLFQEKHVAQELARDLVDTVSKEICASIATHEISALKAERLQKRQLEVAQQKENEFNQLKMQRIHAASEEVYERLLESVVKDTCSTFLNVQRESELLIYDEILMGLFQREFEIILKQIANELNTELLMDKLAENVYFNWNEATSDVCSYNRLG